MENISFRGKIRIVGASYVVTIPKVYLKNNLMDQSKEYIFSVSEVVSDD